MTENASSQKQEHTYQCPQCGCEFTRREDEPEVCKCAQSRERETTGEKGCPCCA